MEKTINKKYKYGSVICLTGNRLCPWVARLTLGYNINGYPVYHFLGAYEEEIDAHLSLRNYNNNPYDIEIEEEKYKKIIQFSKLPSKISILINKVDKSNYTFKQVFKEFSEVNFPTADEIANEKITHKKARGKLGYSNANNLKAAFSSSKNLYDKLYSSLRKSDFERQINSTEGGLSKLSAMAVLYRKLDAFAIDEEIISTSYAQNIKVSCDDTPEGRTPYTYDEIGFIWQQEGNFVADVLLILLYSGMRIEELLEVEISNINLEENYMIGGLKTENGRKRMIPIHSATKHIIFKYYDKNNKYLFSSEDGTPFKYSTFYKYFCQFKEMFGNKFNQKHVIHETRHSTRSEMDRKGANTKCMDLILGHKSQDTGNRVYNHKDFKELKETIELITYKKAEVINIKEKLG